MPLLKKVLFERVLSDLANNHDMSSQLFYDILSFIIVSSIASLFRTMSLSSYQLGT